MSKWLSGFLIVFTALVTGDEATDSNLVQLETMIDRIHSKTLIEAPKNIIAEIKTQEKLNFPHLMSEPSQDWLHDRLVQFQLQLRKDEILVIEKFDVLDKPDAISQLFKQTFWSKVNDKPLSVKGELDRIANYWKEMEKPSVKVSPFGGGNVEWYWWLSTDERPDGLIHVGIDESTRLIWCYEVNRGIYFPVGDILERIRAEIIQNENLVGDRLGKGYMQKHGKKQKKALAP